MNHQHKLEDYSIPLFLTQLEYKQNRINIRRILMSFASVKSVNSLISFELYALYLPLVSQLAFPYLKVVVNLFEGFLGTCRLLQNAKIDSFREEDIWLNLLVNMNRIFFFLLRDWIYLIVVCDMLEPIG